jgi:bacterial leucyl aminopeptidase
MQREGAQTAVYDATLKAPKCAIVGTSCDSGPSLLLGRGTMTGGNETNRPNTINSTCADGNSGTSDESNDRLSIASTSGALTHGNTATVTATVWAWSTLSADALDLYYTANANSPSWTVIGTIVPTVAGAQSSSRTFTHPTGSLQAVRAQFR